MRIALVIATAIVILFTATIAMASHITAYHGSPGHGIKAL